MTMLVKLKKKPFKLKRAAGRVTLTLLLLGACSFGSVQAASFHCPKNASSSEKLVCSDPELSSLDDKLAQLYKRVVDVAPDREAIEDDRVKQWQWRQHNCKDKTCVVNWYNRRIGELDADFNQGTQDQIRVLKTSLAEQNLDLSAQAAVLKIKGDNAALASPQ